MKDFDISLNDLKQLTKWVKESSDIRELSLSYNGLELFISRNESTQRSVSSDAAGTPVTTAPAPSKQEQPELNKPTIAPTASKSSPTADVSVLKLVSK